MHNILTCHHYKPKSDIQRMEWKHTSASIRKKFWIQPSAGKIMMITFCDAKGLFFLEDQRIVKSNFEKTPWISAQGHHSTSRQRPASHNSRNHRKIPFGILPHPLQSWLISTCLVHSRDPAKKFNSNDTIKENALNWLRYKMR